MITRTLLAATLLAAGPAMAAPTPFEAGAAKVDITPKDLSGFWTVWATRYSGVHDPIYARAVVVEDGGTQAALVSTDLVEFGDTATLRQRIARELHIPADHIMISASHDHGAPRAGPITAGTSSGQGRPFSPPAYIGFVDDKVVEAVRKAQAALQPASVGVGRGRADINVDRYGYDGKHWNAADLNGPSDKTVWVVKFADKTGRPIALLLNYAVHSVVAGPGSTQLTGDLAGAAERTVEQHFDGAVALWSMGPAGDQNPRYMNTGKSAADERTAFEGIAAQGFVVGQEAIQTADRITRMADSATIHAGQSQFTCAATPPRAPVPGAVPQFPPNPDFHTPIPAPAEFTVQLSMIQIGDIALAGVSGEIFTHIYWHLKDAAPVSNLVLVTMTNDRIGYIAADEDYDGPYGRPSLVRGCAESGIVDGLTALIHQP
jgi:neutral ceramidase